MPIIYFFSFCARYLNDKEIARIFEELEREEKEEQGESFDDPDDVDYEPQHIEDDSDSEVDLDPAQEDHDDDAETELDDLRFYIGKDGETLWANKTVATVSKTKSKNIIKVWDENLRTVRCTNFLYL